MTKVSKKNHNAKTNENHSSFIVLDHYQDLSFEEVCRNFAVKTPGQLKDQIIWQGIRFIMYELAGNDPDKKHIVRVQDRIFQIAQNQDAIISSLTPALF